MKGIVIFSIAQTLGALTFAGGDVERARLEAYQGIPAILEQLKADGVSIGVEIPDSGLGKQSVERLLGEAGLLRFVAPELIQRAPFAAPLSDAPAVYVAPDRGLRRRAGPQFRAVPHPVLVRAALAGEELFYVRARPRGSLEKFDWSQAIANLDLAPLEVSVEDGVPVLYAVTSASVAKTLGGRVGVERLGAPNLAELTDLVLFQMRFESEAAREFRARLERQPLFVATPRGALVALDRAADAEGLHPPEPEDAHGHTRALLASPTQVTGGAPAPAGEPDKLSEPARKVLETLDPTRLGKHLKLSYGSEVPGCEVGVAIDSRFLYHAHNAVAVTTLVCELQRILGDAHTHAFDWGGRSFHNVYGDLPGKTGELVVIGAHLDSTAARDGGCLAPTDTNCLAPGIDDDASGVAAVLAIASVLELLRDQIGQPERTVRFALFNAEEQGMVGSAAYASALAGTGKQVVGMYQLDMIGTPWLAQAPVSSGGATPSKQPFEAHTAGTGDLTNQRYGQLGSAHSALRDALVYAAQVLSPGLTLQLYPTPGCALDPAAGRSDHTKFQLAGFPACFVAEDFFTEECPSADRPHPTYHRTSDTQIDIDYASAIARSVAGAAWLTANP